MQKMILKKHRDIKLVTTDERKNQLASELNHHNTKYLSKFNGLENE